MLLAARIPEAVSFLAEYAVDVLILDVVLGEANGLDLLRHVRENHPAITVLVITGYPSTETAFAAGLLGAGTYLVKPFTPGQLLVAVREALERVRLRRLADPTRIRVLCPPASQRWPAIHAASFMKPSAAAHMRAWLDRP